MSKAPRHLAVIMDGNGRWAKSRGFDRTAGHRAGTDATRRIVRACGERGVEHLTLYTFSSENWQRPPLEVRAIMSLLIEMVNREVDDLNRNNVRLRTIGDLSVMPEKAREAIESGMERTAGNTGLQLHLALSYGGRQEILEGVRSMARAAQTGRISPEEINEDNFRRSLYAADVPDPDLMIRTGGDHRISNFLLWQLAYAELWFSDVLWPDFDETHLDEAFRDFGGRQRRYGRVLEA
ncbi:MAG TPA: isoprenyl transferase [Fibrobacteria bacterium]|nr:isoprenyl transferase [Fibrobacteria bacterium]